MASETDKPDPAFAILDRATAATDTFRRHLASVGPTEAIGILSTHAVAHSVDVLLSHLTTDQAHFVVTGLRHHHPEWFEASS